MPKHKVPTAQRLHKCKNCKNLLHWTKTDEYSCWAIAPSVRIKDIDTPLPCHAFKGRSGS